MMDLDEAIRHAEEVAEKNEEIYEAHCRIYSKEVVEKYPSPPCKKCASEHRQLAEWLKELKAYKEQSGDAISREAAVNAIYDLCGENVSLKENPWRDNPHMDAVVDALENLPSVTPQPCEDAVSRQAVAQVLLKYAHSTEGKAFAEFLISQINNLPSVTPQQRIGHCKDCKYFEYDSVAKVDGIPLIVAHEICKRWGDGCKSKEDGYCFLFEPKMQEVQDE